MEDGLASGLDHSFVQMNPKYGSGFFVNVEGMHHLHCLVGFRAPKSETNKKTY